MEQEKIQIPASMISAVFGSYDENVKKIQKEYDVTVINRGDDILISGENTNVKKAIQVINSLINIVKSGQTIEEQNINYIITEVNEKHSEDIDKLNSDIICMTVNGRTLRPKTLGQKHYIDSIKNNTVIFGIGPAGTGKTYLAMAMAITAFKNGEVNRIILTRPAIEAGENLGFLPGDLQQKVDPYLRPLYDALYEIMGSGIYAWQDS